MVSFLEKLTGEGKGNLRSLIAAHGKSRIWYLMCGVEEKTRNGI